MSMPTILPVESSKKFGFWAPPISALTRLRSPLVKPYCVAAESGGTNTTETGTSQRPAWGLTLTTLRPDHLLKTSVASALPDSIVYGQGQLVGRSVSAQPPMMLVS